jgi:DNA-binding transcriptional LysR family regulator
MVIRDGIKGLEALVLTARRGSIARAAADLAYSPSHVSRLIVRLESLLGVRLHLRGPNGSELTPEGEDLIATASAVCCGWLQIRSGSRVEPGGRDCVARDGVPCVGLGECPGVPPTS